VRSTSSSPGGCPGSITSASHSTTSFEVLARAAQWNLRVQSTAGGAPRRDECRYRIEVHPPRDWIDDLLAASGAPLTEL
jgi:hypothetical protein